MTLYALNLYFYVFCHCANCQLCIITRSHLVVWLICQCQCIANDAVTFRAGGCTHAWLFSSPCLGLIIVPHMHIHAVTLIFPICLFVNVKQFQGAWARWEGKKEKNIARGATWTKIFDSTCGQRNLSGSSCMPC